MSGARFCETLLNNLDTKKLRCPSAYEHDDWQAFARKHAPRLHRRQSDVSRISCVSLLLAFQDDIVTSNDTVLVRTTDSDPEAVRVSKFGDMKLTQFFFSVRKEHAWVNTMCSTLFHLQKLHKALEHVAQPNRIFSKHAEAKQYKIVRLLNSLHSTDVFHHGTLMDSLIDYDTCQDTITLLQETLAAIQAITHE